MTAPHPQNSAFLGVENSIRGRLWLDGVTDSRLAQTLSQKLDLPEIIARILAARNITLEEADMFLEPTLKHLMPDPSTLQDMNTGSQRLIKAIKEKEKIAIFGDYDVDGATSSALISRYISHFDMAAQIYIPDRITEGYGPNVEAISTLSNENVSLIVMVDCGTRAFEPLQKAKELGLDVIILDHHQAPEELPPTTALINPNRQDDLSGQYHLAAVGVCFLFLAACNKLWREEGQDNIPDLIQYLDLVALGTICDLVPLKTVNRAFVAQGLKVMAGMGNIGLARLSEVVKMNRRPDTYVAGFLFGPRINAAGRLGASHLGAQLLSTQDGAEASNIARELDALNQQRQTIEQDVYLQAEIQAEKMLGVEKNLKCIITSGHNWHPGVVGIVAGRLKEKFNLPSIVIGFKDGEGTGSGRSVEGVDLGKLISQASEQGVITRGGGHAMAAGLSLNEDQLGNLREYFETEMDSNQKRDTPILKIDGALSASGATLELLDLIDRAGPYGMGHPRPKFVFPSHRISYAAIAGVNQVVTCQKVWLILMLHLRKISKHWQRPKKSL
jgi:single-stranded-DNA-specific exonuclease